MTASSRLTVRVGRESPASVVIEAAGDLDLATAPRLRAALYAAAVRRSVVLDASKIEFCDMAGLRALLEVRLYAEAHGRRLRIAAPSVALTHVLEITQTLALFE